MELYTHLGNKVTLYEKIKSGGEGTVWSLKESRLECAKIYHPEKINEELYQKIEAMVNNPPNDPMWIRHAHRSIAWPTSILYSDLKRKQFVGFTMPFIDIKIFKEAHRYYDPTDRISEFGGGFTWRHLLWTAYNIAITVAAIHQKGHRIGDLRETNILVAPNAFITLIDCDSFQIKDKQSGKVYYSRVGTGEYLPPELMHVDFGKQEIDRYYSDLFGLGILIFKFLMNGFHPYQSRGSLVSDIHSIEGKILKGYFACENGYRNLKPPEDAPPYSIIPSSLRKLFHKCFVEGHKNPSKRPTAQEWLTALKEVKFSQCKKNPNHRYSEHLSTCPWCKIAEEMGKDPFPFSMGLQIEAEDPTKGLVSLDTRKEYLITYIKMALSDGVLTQEEKKYIYEMGAKLQIPKRDVEKLISKEIHKTGAKAVTSGIEPQMELTKKDTQFFNMPPNSRVSGSFIISNVGGGVLKGSITTNKKWLKLSQNVIDPTRHRQEIKYYIDTSALPFGFKDKGVLEIHSNGRDREAKIFIDLSVEIPKEAFSMFRFKVIPALAIIFISLSGLIPVLGSVNLIIAFVILGGIVGFGIGEGIGGIIGAGGGLYLGYVTIKEIHGRGALLAGPISGAVTFFILLYFFYFDGGESFDKHILEPLFRYRYAKNKNAVIYLWTIAIVLLITLTLKGFFPF